MYTYKALLDAVELLALGAKQVLGLGEVGLARQIELAQHFDAHCEMAKERGGCRDKIVE